MPGKTSNLYGAFAGSQWRLRQEALQRIIELFELEGTFKDNLVQDFHNEQGHLWLDSHL